jgi:hypothetical protein
MLSQKGSEDASSHDIFISVQDIVSAQEVISGSWTTFFRRIRALCKTFIALEDSPDTRRSTPWLLRLQAYLIEFMVDEVKLFR